MARIRRSFDINNYILNAEIRVDDDLPIELAFKFLQFFLLLKINKTIKFD